VETGTGTSTADGVEAANRRAEQRHVVIPLFGDGNPSLLQHNDLSRQAKPDGPTGRTTHR
jgi:hypothetical protein